MKKNQWPQSFPQIKKSPMVSPFLDREFKVVGLKLY